MLSTGRVVHFYTFKIVQIQKAFYFLNIVKNVDFIRLASKFLYLNHKYIKQQMYLKNLYKKSICDDKCLSVI